MELRQMRCFVRVAELGGKGRATANPGVGAAPGAQRPAPQYRAHIHTVLGVTPIQSAA